MILLQYLSVSLKFGACYITGEWGKFRIKNAFIAFFLSKICVFIIFSSFLMKYQISSTEYQPVRNRNWWSEIVSGSVCITVRIIRGGSRTAATSKMERFVIIVNAVNYYHKALHLGCFNSPRSASDYSSII